MYGGNKKYWYSVSPYAKTQQTNKQTKNSKVSITQKYKRKRNIERDYLTTRLKITRYSIKINQLILMKSKY